MKSIASLLLLPAALLWADTAVTRIDRALEEGAITPGTAACYYVWSVTDSSLLPAEYTDGAEVEPCGTPAFDSAARICATLPAGASGGPAPLLARPVLSGPEQIYNTPGGHFKIHWTTSGVDATDLAWVQWLGDGMDVSWATIIDSMDWDAPPSDLGLGGDTKFDIYIMSLDSGVMGYCSSGGEPPDPTTPEADTASHIAMSNNQSYGDDQMKETCSHEFLHAVENGYEAAEPSWFKENCSVWVQNEVWTTNHYADYLHTGDNCLRKPWYDIRTGSMYHYGASPWPMYMEVRCGGQQVVRQVWEEAAAVVGVNMLPAIDATATSYGMSFEEWLAEYACWRWFTGNLSDDQHYEVEESSLWTPGAYVFSYHTVNTLPASGTAGSYPPDTYGNHWIKVNVQNYQGWITFDFNGRDAIQWQIGIIQTASDGTDAFEWHSVTNSTATYSVGINTTGWQYVVLVVQPITDTSLTLTYDWSVSAQTGIGEQPGDARPTISSSNPFTRGGAISLSLPESGFTTIGVYDLTGRLVDTPLSSNLEAGEHTIAWSAADLPGGAYFLRLNAHGGGMTSRIILQD